MSYRNRRPRTRSPPPRIHREATSSIRGGPRGGSSGVRGSLDNVRRDIRRPFEDNEPKKNQWEPRIRRSRSPRPKGNSHRTGSPERKQSRFDEAKVAPNIPLNEKSAGFVLPPNRGWQPEPVKFSPPPKFPPKDFNTHDYRVSEKSFGTGPPKAKNWGSEVLIIEDDTEEDFNNLPRHSPKGLGPSIVTPRSINQAGNALSGRVTPPPAMSHSELKDDSQGPSIPEFNPENSNLSSQDWIKLIETKAAVQDWKQDEKLYVLSSRLAGYARQWYLNTGIKCKTWGDLRTAFFIAFPSENDYYMLLKKMFVRVKEDRESITSYFHHKVALLNACDIYNRKAVSCIVGGLPNDKMKEDAKLQNFDDPDLLYQYLRSYSEEIEKREKMEAVKKSKSNNKKMANILCMTCKKRGHEASECDMNKLDHLEREARRFAQLASKGLVTSNNVMHGTLSQTPSHSKYFTEVAINGVTLSGYVDTSSLASTIREENAAYFKLPIMKMKSCVVGFAGQPITSSGIIEVPMCIDRAISNVKLHIVPNYVQAIPVVVGQNFIGQPHIVFMDDGGKVRFYQDGGGRSRFDF